MEGSRIRKAEFLDKQVKIQKDMFKRQTLRGYYRETETGSSYNAFESIGGFRDWRAPYGSGVGFNYPYITGGTGFGLVSPRTAGLGFEAKPHLPGGPGTGFGL